MTLKTKLLQLIENPKVVFAIINGVPPCHAVYLLSIKNLIKKDFKTIIDVGANRGDYSKASNFYFPHAIIYAFEPILNKLNKLNSIPNVKVFSLGLWDANDKAMFNIPKEYDLGSSFLEIGDESFIHKEPGKISYKKIEIKRKRFDSLDIKIEKPCLLKIDTEGSELNVLKGFGNKLKDVDIIQLEVNFQENFKNQPKLSDLIKYLEDFGFKAFIQKSVRYDKDNKINHCDLIFIRNKGI